MDTAVALLLAALAAPRFAESCPAHLAGPVSLEADLPRFPTLAACEAVTHHAYLYRDHARAQAAIAPYTADRAWWTEAAEEAGRGWWLWDALRFAADPARDHGSRLYWLREVRRLLSAADWMAGRMPEAVPAWRYRERNP